MATLADRSFRVEFSPAQSSPGPARRFLCGCRDCAFRREEMRLSISGAGEPRKDRPLPASRVPIREEA